MSVNLKNIDHIGIVVDSSEKSINFYTNVLGMKFIGKAKSEVTGDTYTHLILQKKNKLDSHIEFVEITEKSPMVKANMKTGIIHVAYNPKS